MRLFVFLSLIFLFSVSPVGAKELTNQDGLVQDEALQELMQEKADEEAQKLLEGYVDTFGIEDPYYEEYVKPTMQNLSKLYWKLGAFESIEAEMLDNYLLINECEVYKTFFHNDFEWAQVREATKQSITLGRKDFPTKFKLMFPVLLGRYDYDRKGFPLIEDTGLTGFHKLEVIANRMNDKICGHEGEIDFYPKNFALALAKPVTLNFIPVEQELAEKFLDKRKREIGKSSKELSREAYMRLRIDLRRYQGETKNRNFRDLAVIYGVLDGVDLFENETELNLLSIVEEFHGAVEDRDSSTPTDSMFE